MKHKALTPMTKELTQPVAWPHFFSVCYRTPDGKRVALIMPAVVFQQLTKKN